MSFIYPRTISITRPGRKSGAGVQSYSSPSVTTETSIQGNISASIQLISTGGKNPVDLPSDAQKSKYRILFRWTTPSLVNDRDIVTDDLGVRYQVISNYWNSLGYRLECERLET